MSSKGSTHLRSNVVGYLALFVALSGTAYAIDGPLPGQDQVGSADIINNEVSGADIRGNQILSSDVRDDTFANGGLTGTDIADESLSGSDIGFGAVESADVSDGSLTGDDVADQGIGVLDLATDSVNSFKIGTNAVASDEIVNGTVRNAEISVEAVASNQIINGTIQGLDIAAGAVESELAGGGVGAGQLGTITERSADFGVNEGEFASQTVSCAADEQVISGGFDLSFPTRIKITDNQRSGNGWFVQAFNDPGAGDLGGTTVFAYCLSP